MLDFLEIALLAYLIGASIEGVHTFRQLSHSLPVLVERGENESAETPKKTGLVFTIITAVSIGGAFSWPCRLIHRSMKAHQENLDT